MPRAAPWQIARRNEPSPDTKSGNRKEAGIAIVSTVWLQVAPWIFANIDGGC